MTSLDSLLSLIAPTSCITCGNDGPPLCRDCYLKFSDKQANVSECLFCNRKSHSSICRICNKHTGISKIFSLGEHKDELKKLIWDLKFNSKRANAICLTDYLKLKLQELENSKAFIIPAPTAPKRARARGYDQAKLLAKSLAKLEPNWIYKDVLLRNNDSDQIGLGKLERKQRTKDLFLLNPSIKLKAEGKIAILLDDVITTGSTIQAAAKALREFKFDAIVVACLSHKPLETIA